VVGCSGEECGGSGTDDKCWHAYNFIRGHAVYEKATHGMIKCILSGSERR